jgi:hypothetical protein
MNKFQLICSLLFCQFLLAQNDTTLVSKPKIGVISVDKLNVVYRGIQNPISVAVPNAKSFKASGLGVTFSNGHYFISPGQGNEVIVTLEIILEDYSKVIEEHVFRIKTITSIQGRINNRNCENCTVNIKSSELKDAKITVYLEDFIFDFKPQVSSFSIILPNNKSIDIVGNTIDIDTYNQLKKLKKGSIFRIQKINYYAKLHAFFPSAGVINVRISD